MANKDLVENDDIKNVKLNSIDIEKGYQIPTITTTTTTTTDTNTSCNYCVSADSINKKSNCKRRNNDSGAELYSSKCEHHKISSKSSTLLSRAVVAVRKVFLPIIIIILAAFVTLLWYYMGWIYGLSSLCVAFAAVILTKVGWRWFYIAAVTTPRDVKALISFIKLLTLTRRYQRKNMTISDIFEIYVAENPHKACIIYENQTWSFLEINEFANRIANLFHSHGYKNGDIIGLLLENRPEFIAIWLGLSKIGIITPLINTNLRGKTLIHSINIANTMAFIYGENFKDAINEISNELPSTLALYQFNDDINQKIDGIAKDLTKLLQNVAKDKVPNNIERPKHQDRLLYIYTSGTTGLPKAAVISHARYFFIVAAIHYLLNFKKTDIFYTPLPLYHTAGGVMSVGQALLFGATVVIKKKFSASGYFADCKKYNCTVAQYIGEMCRYMLATPSSINDKSHKIRIIFGNGLRPQIWPQFIQRFNIPQVGEFYGATEGNANIVNNDNTIGAIGFISRTIPSVYPITIIRADPNTGEPIRDNNGLCQICKPYEPGVFIGKIIPNNPTREFLGYVDAEASKKKIVRNVFRNGDMAFLSGDLLIADEKGYLYFKDRTGDTFRWKGENVSTSEVEAQVSNVTGFRDTIVYGVEIPHTEGRAGMAAIYDPDYTINLNEFTDNIKKVLPTYARPLFLRILTKIDLTGTFKLRKVDLQKEGFNPNTISEKIYYLTTKGNYEILTSNIYEQIARGELRF